MKYVVSFIRLDPDAVSEDDVPVALINAVKSAYLDLKKEAQGDLSHGVRILLAEGEGDLVTKTARERFTKGG